MLFICIRTDVAAGETALIGLDRQSSGGDLILLHYFNFLLPFLDQWVCSACDLVLDSLLFKYVRCVLLSVGFVLLFFEFASSRPS